MIYNKPKSESLIQRYRETAGLGSFYLARSQLYICKGEYKTIYQQISLVGRGISMSEIIPEHQQ